MVAVNKGGQVAQMYSYQTLDGLVELVEAVARDFRHHRPERYRGLDRDIVKQLASFEMVGMDVKYPDKKTRARYFEAYLGNQFGATPHPVLEQAKSLQRCAARYVEIEEADPNGTNHCLGCVRIAAKGLLQVLIQLTVGAGPRFTRAHARTGAIFQLATSILRNESFAAAFGVNAVGDENWPETEYDRRGGILVREIMANGDSIFASGGDISEMGRSQLENFKAFQDCAFYGARTIKLVSERNRSLKVDGHLARLARTAARWHDALDDLPHKVDRHRFTSSDVADITGQRKDMRLFTSRPHNRT